jgi:alternate signal-mediated exported protein
MHLHLKLAVALCATALLLGGAGTYGLWSDSVDDERANINSSQLRFSDTVAGEWADASSGSPIAIPDIDDFVVVPGDVLTYMLSSTVRARGESLDAILEADPSSITDEPELLKDVHVTTEVSVAGRPTTAITGADNGKALDVVVTLAFGQASLGSGELSGHDLSGLMLTLRRDAR